MRLWWALQPSGVGPQVRQHHVGVEGLVVGDGVALPGQAQFALGQVLGQQAAQLGGAQVAQALQQGGVGRRHGATLSGQRGLEVKKACSACSELAGSSVF